MPLSLVSHFHRLCRLLDNSSEENHSSGGELSGGEEEVTVGVGDILVMALEERKNKREAEKTLSQLQENYDRLQRKYAEAENTIDKYR